VDFQAIAAAFRRLPADATSCEAALWHLETWWTGAAYTAYRPQLESLVRRQQWETLLDSFYRVMPFGTGGRRGPVGIGPNRINPHTVVTSAQGHVHYLRRHWYEMTLRLVVAFDVRVFRDLRGLYDPSVSNPLIGLSSRDLARMACAVYAANGVEVYTVTGEDDYFLSTPELSFAIRDLQAHGGLNISASHNHPDDNGAKLYLASGGQPVPPDDEDLAAEVEAITEVPQADFEAAVSAGRVHWWDAVRHERYLQANLACSIDPQARRARVAYSPLHGTGAHTVGDLLSRAGFEVHLAAKQRAPDGAFPAVKFRAPNPEVPESMEVVTGEAHQCTADIALATDPDADRLGVVAPFDGNWRYLTGNEIAFLLAVFIVESRRASGTLPPLGFMVKTAVTTELLTRVARAHGLQIVGDLLVGFKYVGRVLDVIANHGQYGDVRATLDDFLLAAEESNGVLVSAALRDKDAAGGALLLAELCAGLRRNGTTLGAYLEDAYRRYGYGANIGYSLMMSGASGLQLLNQMMDRLRAEPPAMLGGRGLRRAVDYWHEGEFGAIRSQTDRSARNFLRLEYDGGLQVSIRPSGTEPKIKFYTEQLFDPSATWEGNGFAAARRVMDETTQAVTLALVQGALRLVDIDLPRPALVVSSLVSLENRIDFASRFLPELTAQLRTAGPNDIGHLEAWVDERLKGYGADARDLVAAGVSAYSAECDLPPIALDLLRELFNLR